MFGPGSGTDQIRGFEAGIDRVQLSGSEPASFDDFWAAFETTALGVTLQLEDGSSLSLVGIAASQLGAGDFLWA